MPDGFDPHRELARIYTLQELMSECRSRTPTILALADQMLADPEIGPDTKLRVMEFVVNRGYGKPRQHLIVSDPNDRPVATNPVRITMPDNGRNPGGRVFDQDGEVTNVG
jgi:hypothetical protein